MSYFSNVRTVSCCAGVIVRPARAVCSLVLLTLLSLAVPSSSAADEAGAALIDINTADVMMLEQSLDGIGTVKAQAIVDYREAQGGFLHIDELQQVPGIGEVLYARIKALLSVSPVAKGEAQQHNVDAKLPVHSDS